MAKRLIGFGCADDHYPSCERPDRWGGAIVPVVPLRFSNVLVRIQGLVEKRAAAWLSEPLPMTMCAATKKGSNSMRIVTLLLVLSALAGCAQTAGGASSVREDYYGGDGGFYAGAVAPR